MTAITCNVEMLTEKTVNNLQVLLRQFEGCICTRATNDSLTIRKDNFPGYVIIRPGLTKGCVFAVWINEIKQEPFPLFQSQAVAASLYFDEFSYR